MQNDNRQQDDMSRSCQCLRIRLGEMSLLVPRVLVAEVLEPGELQFSSSLCPEIRYFAWRGYQVPLLAPSVLGCHQQVLSTVSSRILVFHGLLRHDLIAFWSLPVSTNPTLVMVDESLQPAGQDAADAGRMLQAVSLGDERVHVLRVDPVEMFIQKNLFRQSGAGELSTP